MSEQPTGPAPVVESGVPPAPAVVGLTPLAQQYLDQTRPWVRFISVITFIAAGFMLVGGLVVLAISVLGGFAAGGDRGMGALGGAVGAGLLALFYVVLAFVYLAPAAYLFQYASAISSLRARPSEAALEHALKQQKSFWRAVGILTVIGLILGLAVFVLAFVAGAIAAVMAGR